MELLKRIGLALGWLTGALAGISAVLVATGFLAAGIEAKLLGLTWAPGSPRVAELAGLGGRVLATFLVALVAVVAALVLPVSALRRAVLGAPAAGAAASARVPWLSTALLALLSVGLLLVLSAVMYDDDLLVDLATGDCPGFEAPVTELSQLPGALRLAKATQGPAGDSDAAALLTALAVLVLLLCAGITALVAVLLPRLRRAGWPEAPTLLSIVAAAAVAYAVPVNYSYLLDRIELRPIALPGPPADAGAAAGGAIYLVRLSGDGLWAFEPAAQRFHWIGRSELNRAIFGPAVSIREAIGC